MEFAQRHRRCKCYCFSWDRCYSYCYSHKRRSIQRTETQRYVCICFDGQLIVFNTHTILLTKSISSLSYLKSNNYKKSGTLIRKRGKKTMKMMMTQQQQHQWQQQRRGDRRCGWVFNSRSTLILIILLLSPTKKKDYQKKGMVLAIHSRTRILSFDKTIQTRMTMTVMMTIHGADWW